MLNIKSFPIAIGIILFFCVISVPLFAQDKTIDSLKLALKNAKHDTTRCAILNEIIELDNYGNTWKNYNETLYKISLKHSYNKFPVSTLYLKYFTIAMNNKGIMAQDEDNLTKALNIYTINLKIQKLIKYKLGQATTLCNIGEVYADKGQFLNAVEYYKKSLEIFKAIANSEQIANTLQKMGSVYSKQADIKNALNYYEQSLNIQEKINDKQGIAATINNLAIIYFGQKDYQTALVYFNKSLKVYTELGDKVGIATTLGNIGQIYQKQKDREHAFINFKRSLSIFEELKLKSETAITLKNIGSLYEDSDSLNLALMYYEKSLQLIINSEKKRPVALVLNYLGGLHYKQKKYAQSIEYASKALKLAKQINIPAEIKASAKLLYLIYKKTNNPKLSLANYELYIQMRDSISNTETRKASIKNQLKYEYEKKAAADSVKVAEEKKLTTVKLKQEQTQRYFLYGGLGLTALFGIFMFNRFRITNKQKTIIQQQKLIVENQKHIVDEKQKEILDSIHYAKRIQQSLLPTEKFIERVLKNKNEN